ncbi:MAG: hypothetical protein E5X43_14020, partial [Mesorhizobium sp.]
MMAATRPAKPALRPTPLCPAGLSGRTEGGGKDRCFYKIAVAFLFAALVALLLAAPASAAKIDDQFHAWLQADLWPEANAKGIS